jgi:hypothetical protein
MVQISNVMSKDLNFCGSNGANGSSSVGVRHVM